MLAEFQYKVHFRTDYTERDIVQGKKNEKRGAKKKKKIKHFYNHCCGGGTRYPAADPGRLLGLEPLQG